MHGSSRASSRHLPIQYQRYCKCLDLLSCEFLLLKLGGLQYSDAVGRGRQVNLEHGPSPV